MIERDNIDLEMAQIVEASIKPLESAKAKGKPVKNRVSFSRNERLANVEALADNLRHHAEKNHVHVTRYELSELDKNENYNLVYWQVRIVPGKKTNAIGK